MKKALFLFFIFSKLSIQCHFSDLKIYKNDKQFDNWKMVSPDCYNPALNGEYNVALNVIKDGDIFFDVGANFGTYTNTIVQNRKKTIIYAFEPVLQIFLLLEKNIREYKLNDKNILAKYWNDIIKNFNANDIDKMKNTATMQSIVDENENSIYLINIALSNRKGNTSFNFDIQKPSIGGIDKRKPIIVNVETSTVDNICIRNKINKINYLKIDTEGHDYKVILGTSKLLKNRLVDFIQFEYIARCKKANWNLKKAYDYFRELGYSLFKIVADGIVFMDEWRPELENYKYANFLAVSPDIYKN